MARCDKINLTNLPLVSRAGLLFTNKFGGFEGKITTPLPELPVLYVSEGTLVLSNDDCSCVCEKSSTLLELIAATETLYEMKY